MARLSDIKLLLGITDCSKDELLNLLIENATEFAVNFTHNDKAGDFAGCIARMVVYDYNRMGTEGLNSESYSGLNFNYETDYPEPILKQLRDFRKVRVPS